MFVKKMVIFIKKSYMNTGEVIYVIERKNGIKGEVLWIYHSFNQ